MNFTREPILETIIAAKEGFKLRLKSTKNDGAAEYLVDAVEVVSFGTTFFYRSGEPAHTFFVPAQDFEIVQVRQARLMLKTPVDKAVKIAGGAEAGKKSSTEKTTDKKKKKASKEAKSAKSSEKKEIAEVTSEKKAAPAAAEKKDAPAKKAHKGRTTRKTASKDQKVKGDDEAAPKEIMQPSMFSHLLRPPEALISDTIGQYQDIIDKQNEEKADDKKEAMVNVTSESVEQKVEAVIADTSSELENVTSEQLAPPKELVSEKIASEMAEEKPLTLKEKMKKVLSPSIKEPANKTDSE
ncbi:MAG: hypothetical protein SP4CHLAM5_06350 [Chlamydiia bacterium]|nr:hypothetical protein [Chlamydiia bacterium]MCH9618504.1 hypothetical protein [Chlamydiia bacterium]MCH9623793.1 hypothetical protein [Chlamydiia bacterium]